MEIIFGTSDVEVGDIGGLRERSQYKVQFHMKYPTNFHRFLRSKPKAKSLEKIFPNSPIYIFTGKIKEIKSLKALKDYKISYYLVDTGIPLVIEHYENPKYGFKVGDWVSGVGLLFGFVSLFIEEFLNNCVTVRISRINEIKHGESKYFVIEGKI